jgi:hypothetical protein
MAKAEDKDEWGVPSWGKKKSSKDAPLYITKGSLHPLFRNLISSFEGVGTEHKSQW